MQDTPQQPQKPQAKKAHERIIAAVGNYMSLIADYQSKRKAKNDSKPIENILTKDQYATSGWLGLDRIINDLTVNLLNAFVAKKAYSFGYNKADFSYGDGGLLLKEPCNCANNPLTVNEKKVERMKAEKWLYAWLAAAKKWNQEGCKELNETASPKKASNRNEKIASVPAKKGKISEV